VQTRSQYVTTIRGLARATGVLLPKSATGGFLEKVASSAIDEELRALIDPLVRSLEVLDAEIVKVEARLAQLAEQDPTIALCATAPGVGPVVAATYVSVIDLWAMLRDGTLYDARLEAKRVPGACASMLGARQVTRASWSRSRRNFGVPPHRRTPRPNVSRPKCDEPYGGHEPPNTQSMLRRAERCSSASPKSTQLVAMNASVLVKLSTNPHASSREHLA